MDVSPERIAEIIRKVDGNHTMGASALADAIIQEIGKDRPLSDLEIVQKALNKSNATLIYLHNAVWEVCSHDFVLADGAGLESLLTWAKQTIGVE